MGMSRDMDREGSIVVSTAQLHETLDFRTHDV